MAEYSNIEDVKDELLDKYMREEDHEEADEYVNKIMAMKGFNDKSFTAAFGDRGLETRHELAMEFAMYRRAFYLTRERDDKFGVKYVEHEIKIRGCIRSLIRLMISRKPVDMKRCIDQVHDDSRSISDKLLVIEALIRTVQPEIDNLAHAHGVERARCLISNVASEMEMSGYYKSKPHGYKGD